MKINALIISIFLVVIFLCKGCKEYLDFKGDNTTVVANNLDHLQALLNDAVRMNQQVTPSMTENWADDYFQLPSRYELQDLARQKVYIWELSQYNHPNDWSASYQPIYNANYCLEMLQKLNRETEDKVKFDQIMGAAMFFRAYYFQQLLWTFGATYDESTAAIDKGIVLKEDTDFNIPSSISSVQMSYDKIISDVELSLQLLPELPSLPTLPSKASAHALLARTYLSMRKYSEALYHANEALKLKDDLMDYNLQSDGVFQGRNPSFNKYNKETIFYTEMNQHQGALYLNARGGRVDTLLYNQYLPGDLRLNCFFLPADGYYAFKGSYAESRMFTGLATDELFLIRAECKARANDLSGAMIDLNHLLKNRFTNNSTFVPIQVSNLKNALDIILLERRKQLLFRGLRLMDIKRLNKEGYNISVKRKINGVEYVLDPNDPKFVIPLPSDLHNFIN